MVTKMIHEMLLTRPHDAAFTAFGSHRPNVHSKMSCFAAIYTRAFCPGVHSAAGLCVNSALVTAPRC
jgi:hypothetical protein